MMRAVVLEELTDEEDRTISVPEVETLILRCGQAGNQQVQWTWSEGNLNSTCFTVSVFGGEGVHAFSLICVVCVRVCVSTCSDSTQGRTSLRCL